MLSKEMIRVQLAGKASYRRSAENAKHADEGPGVHALKFGWVRERNCTEEYLNTHLVRNSILYKVVLADEKLVINLLKCKKEEKVNMDPESTVYICFHKLENEYVAAAVCVLATCQLQEPSTLWDDLGRAVMTVLNQNNAISCGCRLHTILIKNWGAATEVGARRSFLLGMASRFQPNMSVQNVESIDSPC
jgi:hypothetical protein